MPSHPLPWLSLDSPFPPIEQAWPQESEAPGLLAAGADLSVSRLLAAYRQGIFPWYSEDQPILWWSTDPRMVLDTHQFRIHRSFRKILRRFIATPNCEIRIDYDFARVIARCASTPRDGQNGTWIVKPMVQAYTALHHAGHAHSVETWVEGRLVGGLYCVGIGHAVFGESMFSVESDGSKIALAALVALCLQHGVTAIDCQQQTRHLYSLGARPWSRTTFQAQLIRECEQQPIDWTWKHLYWNPLLAARQPDDVRPE